MSKDGYTGTVDEGGFVFGEDHEISLGRESKQQATKVEAGSGEEVVHNRRAM